jgi:FeS assembly protein IscX
VYWDDAYPIAVQLRQRYPQIDPTHLSREELQMRVTQLPNFADNPSDAQLNLLEEIQREWVDLV